MRWDERLTGEFTAADRRAERLVGGLTLEQLNWRPRPEAWSIGQCVEHLYSTNVVYLQAISAALEGQKQAPVDEIHPGWFGRWFIRKFIEPGEASAKARAPKKIVPSGEVGCEILELFVRSNAEAREVVRRASEFDVNRIRFRNPFVGVIRFTVGTGLMIVARHQVRHLMQGERVRESAGFPG